MVTLKRFRSQEGTSLLEVMVAVAIASIALVSFISLVLSSIAMEDHSRKVTEATLIADQRMKEIEQDPFPEVSTKEGLIDEKDPSGFYYKLQVQETPIENVRQVAIQILWDNKRRSVDLTTYMAKKD